MPREISDEQFEALVAAGHIVDVTDDDLDGHDHDDDQTAAPPTAAAPDAKEVAVVRTDLLAQASQHEAEGNYRAAAVLKSQAAFAPDSALVAPAPPAAPEPVADLGKAISEAESSGEWQRALALKTRQLLGVGH